MSKPKTVKITAILLSAFRAVSESIFFILLTSCNTGADSKKEKYTKFSI